MIAPNPSPVDRPEVSYPTIPPIGQIGEDDHGDVVSYLQGLAQEASEGGRDEWADVADRSMTIYTYGADPIPLDTKVVVNEIQNAVISITDIQTKEPPAVSLEPVERGEPPVCFWAGPPDLGTLLGVAPEQMQEWPGPDGTMQAPLPLTESQADRIRDAIIAGGMPIAPAMPAAGPDGKPIADQATGAPVMAPPPMRAVKDTWLVEVNDQLMADTYQGVFDVLWQRSGMDRRIRSNLLWTNIHGWTLWLYEFDDDEHKFIVRPMSIKQVYVDPTIEDIRDAAYAMIDLLIDVAEAKRRYPQIADEIDQWAQSGQPQRVDGFTQFGDAFDRTFQRGMVTMRVAWLRNQPCPYELDEALARGMVEQIEVPDGTAEQTGHEDPGDGGDGDTGGMDGSDADLVRELAEPGEPDVSQGPGEGGGVAVVPALPATRTAIVLAGTDIEVTPGDANWPTYNCIRQITTIRSVVVEDKASEFWDIPLLHNTCIPVPHRPWGIGEPFRLANLQAAQNDVVDAMVAYIKSFKAPVQMMSESMWQSTQAVYAANAYLKPGKLIVVPDDIWIASGGKIDSIINPPPMPEGLMQLHPLLRQIITELSGNADVLQGRAQSQIKSGKAIELLQTSAASMIGFKSQRTGDMIHDFGRLGLHSIVTRMTVEDIGRIVSKYKPHVLAAIHERAQSAEWDVSVTVSSGNGAVLAQKKEQAFRDRQIGAISLESYQEAAGIDPRTEKQRLAKEQQEMMRGAAGATAPPGAAPQQPGQPPVPGGGPRTRGEG